MLSIIGILPFSASAILMDFNDYNINIYASPSQDGDGLYTIENNGHTLTLKGNTWRSIDFNYTVTTDTMLSFDYMSTKEGNIQGIGFDDDAQLNPEDLLFELFGSQTRGNQSFNTYDHLGTWVTYEISVGNYATGAFSTLFFANDSDSANPDAVSTFRNIVVCEGCDRAPSLIPVTEPNSFALIGFGLFGFFARAYATSKPILVA